MPTSHPVHAPDATSRFFVTPIQVLARAAGMAFLAIGVLGFVPGVFGASVLNDLLHVAVGIAGLVLARTFPSARIYFACGAAIFVGSAGYGFTIHRDVGSVADWLHLGVALAMVAIGAALGRLRARG